MNPRPDGPRQLLQSILKNSPEAMRHEIRANLAKFDQAFFDDLAEVIRQMRTRIDPGNAQDAHGIDLLERLPQMISQARVGKDRELELAAVTEALSRGHRHFEANEWHEARRAAQEVLEISTRVEHRYGAVSALMLLGLTAEASSDWTCAVSLYRQVADQSRANHFWRLEASAVFREGELLRAAGDQSKAREMFQRHLEIGVLLDAADLRAPAHLELAATYAGNALDSAEHHWQTALSEGQAIGDQYVIAYAALNLGLVYLQSDRSQMARPFLLKAKAAFAAQDDADGLAIVNSYLERTENAGTPQGSAEDVNQLNQEALSAFEIGDLKSAEEIWKRASVFAQKSANYGGQAVALSNLGKLYRDRRHDPAEALRLFHEAVSAARKAGQAHLQAAILNSIGRVHRSLGQRPEAKHAFQAAAAAGERADDPVTLGTILINLGNVYKQDNEVREAKPHYQRALELGEKANDHEIQTLALGNLGNVEYLSGNMAEAEALYRKGLRIAEAAGYSQGVANQSGNLGGLFGHMNNWAASVSFFERAVQVANSMKDPELQIGGLRNLALALKNLGRNQEALEYLNQATQVPAAGIRPDIVDAIYDLRAEVFANLHETAAADADWQVLQQRIESRCDHEFTVERDIRAYEPLAGMAVSRLTATLAFANSEQIAGQIESIRAKPFCIASGVRPLDAQGIARLLESRPEKTAFVHFAVLRERIVVVGHQPGWPLPRMEVLNLTLDDLVDCRTRQLNEVERHIEQPDLDETWLDIIAELADAVAELVSGCEVAYLCPHSLLWQLPLHAAVTGGVPLLERLPVVYIDSATRLAHLWQSPPKPMRSCFAAGVGVTSNDDPLFQGEAKLVTKLFASEALVGARVTRQRILNGMPGHDVVHLSTHGRWGFKSTALILRDETELLFANDVERLNIPARVVYLSGCDSGWLDVTALSVGMRGFPAAFLEAGASSVVAASWPVSAPASIQIVHSFYQELQKPGATVAKALQQAELGIRKKNYYGGRTYYWAPFSVVGDGR
jgi:CHAT domain-containing protein/tetratricopeptide (TPR) repeat protein